jgi:hypothetical protein
MAVAVAEQVVQEQQQPHKRQPVLVVQEHQVRLLEQQ